MKALALFVVLLSMLSLASCSHYLTIKIAPRTEECFYEEFEAGEEATVDFEVTEGGLLDIELLVYGPAPTNKLLVQNLVYFNDDDNDGYQTFVTEVRGAHRICFNNKMSRWTPKKVTFVLNSSTEKKHEKEDIAKLEHLGPMVDSVINIAEQLEKLEQVQHHLSMREKINRNIAETTNARAFWFSFLESLLLIFMSCIQLFYVRQWFEQEKRIRGV